jgi:hypothetical protein
MNKLNNIEKNVLAVALDHMDEHLYDLANELDKYSGGVNASTLQARIDGLETLRKKLL